MEMLLFIVGILLFGIFNTIIKPGNNRCRDNSSLVLYNCLFCTGAALFAFIVADESFTLPIYTYIAAFLFGILFCSTTYLYMKTIQIGPLSLSALIITFSLIIPLIYSFFFLGEKLTLVKGLGIILLIMCVFISSNPRVRDKNLSMRWFALALLTLLSNGILSTVGKAHQVYSGGVYTGQFVTLGYAFAALSSLLLFCFLQHKEKADVRYFFSPIMMLIVLVTAICSFGANYIVAKLAATMDGSIIYPAVQGGSLVIVTLCSMLFLKEKINLRKLITIGIGIISVILLNV